MFPILSLFFFGCQKSPQPLAPAPEETPLPSPEIPAAPSSTPVPTPSPTPQARLAPKGTYYVISRFSTTTDQGIYGFQVGEKVTLVKESGADLVVSDGKVEATAPKSSFTNDLDVIAQVTAQNNESRKKISQTVQGAAQKQQEYVNSQRQSSDDAVSRARDQQRAIALADLKSARTALQNRISRARQEISEKQWNHRIKGTMISLSPDASQITSLESKLAALDAQIAGFHTR